MKMILRILYLLISPLILPVLTLAFIIYFLGETTIGLQTSVELMKRVIPGDFKVQHAQGKLFSEFTLNHITYQHANAEVSIQFFDFAWQPKQLLKNKFYIQHLYFHDAIIKLTTTANSKARDFNFDRLKFYLHHVRANQIAIYNVAFSQNNKPPIKIEEIRLMQTAAENFSFYAKSAHGNIEGNLTDEWNARWNFQISDLGSIIPASGGNLALSGTLKGPRFAPIINADILAKQLFYSGQTINSLSGKINLTLKPDTLSTLTLNLTDIKLKNYKMKNLFITATSTTTKKQRDWLTSLTVLVNKNPFLTALFTLPNTITFENLTATTLSAKLNLSPINIETFASYAPMVKNLHGKMGGAIELNGTIDKPIIYSEANLTNGNVTIPPLGITLKNIALRLKGDDLKHLNYSGHFNSAQGTAEFTGVTDLTQSGFPSTIKLDGKNLQVVNLEEYKINASPDIILTLANKILLVQGSIFIPEAKIQPKNFSTVVTMSSDVVFVGEKKPAAPALLQYLPSLQVNISLGDKIYLHYQDLEAVLKGNVTISKEPNNPATGIGELYATKGTYNAYKKILAIKEGHLIYTGNLITNPGLNIKATREMKTVQTGAISDFTTTQAYEGTQTLTLGVQVSGTLEKPQISLYSSPSLSQVDILSYLVLGIPSSQASGGNAQALLAAASALDLGGNGISHLTNITNGLKKTLGLSELNVESVQTFDPTANQNTGGVVGNTSLVVGKQLAENLSVHYSTSLNLLNPVSTFNLRYKLSKRFAIQSETSTIDTGADLLYSIERD